MDPKNLSDEELQAAIDNTNPNQDEPAGNPGTTPPPNPAPTDEPAGDEPKRTPDGRFAPSGDEPAGDDPQGQPDEPQHDPEEQKPPSRREQLRIQQLLERGKQNNIRPQEQSRPPREGAIDYAQELDADPAVIARLEEDRRTAENARYQEGVRQAAAYEWRTLLQVDAPQIEREHPQLDKRSPEFHPALAASLTDMYLQMSGFDNETGLPSNPGMRWSDFVESFWELADEIGNLSTQQATKEVAQQAANAGLRPGGTSTKLNLNKAPEQMNDAELEAYLASQGLAPAKRR